MHEYNSLSNEIMGSCCTWADRRHIVFFIVSWLLFFVSISRFRILWLSTCIFCIVVLNAQLSSGVDSAPVQSGKICQGFPQKQHMTYMHLILYENIACDYYFIDFYYFSPLLFFSWKFSVLMSCALLFLFHNYCDNDF